MRRLLSSFLLLGLVILAWPALSIAQVEATELEPLEPDPAFADSLPDPEHFRATVIKVEDTKTDQYGQEQTYQQVRLRIDSGTEKGIHVNVEHGLTFAINENQHVKAGEKLVATRNWKIDGSHFWTISDKYRLDKLWLVGAIFIGLVLLVARFKGLLSLVGLLASIGVLGVFVVPQIIAGWSPILVSLVGSVAIIFLSVYLTHGFNRQTHVAVAATVITLVLAIGLSVFVVNLLGLTGTGSDDAYNLQFGLQNLDLRGLLLGGMIIGTLGVLDDITINQVAVVTEVYDANRRQSVRQLFKRGLRVGREHIASLVNTLILAYAGTSLSVFIFIALSDLPLWVLLNTEFALEEIVRALVGSSALVLAVPITTWLAANLVKKYDLGKPLHHHA